MVSPTPSPTLEPIVDESLRGPAPDILPQVERGELVKTPVSPAPDTLRQVERAELVKAPAEPAPDRLDQVERAALVKLPPKLAPDTLAQVERAVPRAEPVAAPDTLSQVEKGVLIGKAVPAPSKAIQEPTDRVPIPNAPIKRVGPEQIPNAPVGQAKPEQLPNAPVTPEAVQAKPAPEQETTFMGMPILGREAPPQKTSTIPSQPAPSDKAPLSIDTDYNAQAGSYHAGRPGDGKIQGIVLHSSDGRESGDINTLTTGGVSSHYYVTRDGRIYQFVNDQDTAYHAGKVVGNLGNGNTIGIEQEHYDPGGKGGKNGEAWSPAQVAATARLVASLKAKYGLTDAQIVGHSDVAPDRKQDPYNYPWEDFRRQVNGQPGAVAVAGQPEKGFIKGRATTFGYHDPNDPGVGSPKLGKINTNEGSLVGIAIPEEALRAQIGANPAAWRKARVEIVTSDGRHMLVPIVDLGPGDVQQTKGIAADFTHGLATVLKHSDENNYQFRIIPNAGVDVTKNPQAFVAEQAQLAKGVDLSPKAKTPAAVMGGYVLVPETEEQKADSTQQVQAQVQAQQNVLSALHDHTQNMPSWYHALEKPIPGVSDAVRDATREEFKKQITAYAQDYYKEPDPDKAFVRIMQAPNLLTSAGEILSKAPAHVQHALLAWSRGLDANGENRIIDFINKVHPEATPEARAGFVREILSKPAGNERTQFVSALYSSVDPQITQGISLPALLDSIDTVSQPGYQEKRKTEINAAVAKNLKDLRTDPTMENTWGGTVSDAIAQMPKNLGEALFPVIGQSAMTSEIYFDTLDGLRKEHPDWSEDQLKAKAGAASVPQVVLQEVVNLATMGLGGGLVKGITNPVARIAANSILHGGIAGTAATVQQGVANVATGRPITEGMPQAAIVGGIQGTIGGAMHAPEARPRGALEPTTGPKGGEIRGPTERTLEETHPPPVTAQGEPVRPVEPSIVRPEVQPPPLPPEAHSDQNLEQRSIPSVRTPEEGNRGMTEEEAHAYLDTLSNEIEQRHQARASDVGLIPREENPHATVHDVPPPVPTTPSVPPERFSLGAPVPEKGLSVPEANKVVNAFKEQFPHAPPIDVVGARTELPAHLQDAIAQHAGDHSVEALIHDGRVRVVAGENVSPEQLHKALLEESIGHYGVEQVLGKKFDHLTNVVSKSMTGHPQYEALKPIYGDNPRTLAAEYIARAARGQIESPSVWAHVKTWFNQLARKLGFKRAFSDSELRVLLSRARGRLEKGGGRSTVVTGPPRFHLRRKISHRLKARRSPGPAKKSYRVSTGIHRLD